MKIYLKLIMLVCFVLFLEQIAVSQNVGINVTGAEPNEKALLDIDVSGTNPKGLLIPRITDEEKLSITAPIPESLMIYNTTTQCFEAYNGTGWICIGCIDGEVPATFNTGVVEVQNLYTGRIWMDRNLGASHKAYFMQDTLAYGDLYQWGRRADGHQNRYSEVTDLQTPFNNPGHPYFISESDGGTGSFINWRNPGNDNFWQGVNGINNPCPSGFRVPTALEWELEYLTWPTQDATGAFNCPRKFVPAGRRFAVYDGALNDVGTNGRYWTSTFIPGTSFAKILCFGSTGVIIYDNTNGGEFSGGYYVAGRTTGASIRCIKD